MKKGQYKSIAAQIMDDYGSYLDGEALPGERELAEKYETDEETIEKLNSEAITRIDDVKVILSDNVIVPNFITVDELREKRQNKEKTNIYQ